jgi:hypothetical protein
MHDVRPRANSRPDPAPVAVGCKRTPAPAPTTAPSTQASTKPTTKPKELTYVDVIRTNYPKLPATQPLGVPVDLNDAGKFILDVPVYLCPRGDLWITHRDAAATDPVIWRAGEDQIHLIREPVAFVFWATDEDGKWFPRPVVKTSSGAFLWIDREGRRPLTAGRAYRWDAAMVLNNGVAVPTDRGVSVFTFAPEFKEDYHEVVKEPGRSEPQIVLDASGFIAWSPWDGQKPGSNGVVRYGGDGKWTDIPPSEQWPEKILHLVPLLDGTVLQLFRETDKGPVKLAMSVMQSVAIDEKVIEDLVEKLSENDPEVRNAAYNELTRYGNSSWPILEKDASGSAARDAHSAAGIAAQSHPADARRAGADRWRHASRRSLHRRRNRAVSACRRARAGSVRCAETAARGEAGVDQHPARPRDGAARSGRRPPVPAGEGAVVRIRR